MDLLYGAPAYLPAPDTSGATPSKASKSHVHPYPLKILDLGGNCGMSALHMATRFPLATVISVEPAITNHHMLVRVDKAAVWLGVPLRG